MTGGCGDVAISRLTEPFSGLYDFTTQWNAVHYHRSFAVTHLYRVWIFGTAPHTLWTLGLPALPEEL